MNSQRRVWTAWKLANSVKNYARKLLLIGHQLSKDETSKIAVEYILAGVSVGDITEEVIPETVDTEVKSLVSQGELMELPAS